MKGYRFYLEFPTAAAKKKSGKDHKGHSGNVFAAMDVMGDGFRPFYSAMEGFKYEGLGAVYAWPNSGVAGTSASLDYLRSRCKRIPERRAREIHPTLFLRIDA